MDYHEKAELILAIIQGILAISALYIAFHFIVKFW